MFLHLIVYFSPQDVLDGLYFIYDSCVIRKKKFISWPVFLNRKLLQFIHQKKSCCSLIQQKKKKKRLLQFRGCLVCDFKQQPFSIFKQHFTHFNVLFHPHVFLQIFSNNNFQFLNTYTKRALNHCGPKILGFELRITCSYSMIYY